MKENFDETTVSKVLKWSYKSATEGFKGVDSAEALALEYLVTDGTLREKVDRLIRWQNTKAGATGFLTGLGGIITMPVTIPSNIAVVLFVQIRMVAAIAHMCGQDLKSDRVQTLAYACLAGDGAKEILRNSGILLGSKLTKSAISSVSGKTLTQINQRVGFRLLTKFGEKGVLNLGKAVPLVGGMISATVDSVATNVVGNVARDTFLPLARDDDA